MASNLAHVYGVENDDEAFDLMEVELFEITAANGSSTATLGEFSFRSFHVPDPFPKNDAISGVMLEGYDVFFTP